ncbi:MAG: peptidoglycan-associated lipoprotein Pal [Rhodospirillales bacterium]|nr:peptidoglycan-associated lipoprotein Pal [Alphaproteobacteria bacterium]MCB9986263.1 peptidoglycan-associated lipoprotein Pal [Rhodospirillales bacterium]USO07184.1 MAG: peptidoglycan-associated lipoprotein Pal [Rhodospirillales bacterium]
MRTPTRYKLLTLLALSTLALAACAKGKQEQPYADSVVEGQGQVQGQGEGMLGDQGAGMAGVQGNTLPGSQEDLTVNVGDRVYFGYDRYDLTPEALQQLQLQSQWLNQYPNVTVMIEGNTDERGTREYNLALGDRRANAVRDYLVSLGVSPSRIKTISYGKERPEVTGSDPQSWAQNRRAVTRVE